jgi:hypothetical protein
LDDLFAGLSTPEGAGLTLLFSLSHDFPSEWAAFVNGTGNFTATVKRDYFPYFTQGRTITVTGLELYAADPAKHHAVGDTDVATTDLLINNAFIVTVPPDTAGPGQVLIRNAGLEVFLAVRYTLD